jgi:hypothetical protein
MSMDRIIREEARLIVLRALNDQADGRLNSEALRRGLIEFGINQTREWVEEELRWLDTIGAITRMQAGSVILAALTTKGRDHVERATVINGIKRPSPVGEDIVSGGIALIRGRLEG